MIDRCDRMGQQRHGVGRQFDSTGRAFARLASPGFRRYMSPPFFMSKPRVTLYDTTLRDGTQGTGISFSMLDKIRVAEKLDAFGVHYIEGGFPGSNPKDAEFFNEAKNRQWKNAKISAFGATRRGKRKVEDDPQVRILLEAETPAVTIVGKTWPLQVTEVLGVTREENLAMI